MAVATDLGIDPTGALRSAPLARGRRWTRVLFANPVAVVSAVFLAAGDLAAAFAPC